METSLSIRIIEQVFAFADGVVKVILTSARKGITAFDALKLASKMEHGITFRAKGCGVKAFVTEIDGEANEIDGYGWVYSVNGRVPEIGCGQYVLKLGDIVRWEYVAFDKQLNQR